MIKTIKKQIGRRVAQIKKKSGPFVKKYKQKTTSFIKARPLASFFVSLGLLLAFLLIGQLLHTKVEEPKKELPVKKVQVYSIGDAPKATFQAKIEKAGVVTIVAQSGGVVQSIQVTEGDKIGQGQTLLTLSSNYQGGNAPAVQRQIAQTQYQNVLDTFDQQKDLIKKQRDISNTTDENTDKQRDIAKKSLDETNALINANQSVIDALKLNAPSTQNDMQINQIQAGLNQLRDAARSLDYASSGDNPPAKLSNVQKDITLQQLDLQEKGLDLSKEISRLQVSLAYINEATMYPASPFAGTVERVNVAAGQFVNPGTVLATIAAHEIATTAVLSVPEAISKIILSGEPSELIINGKKIAVTPYHVSTQATAGQLYTVVYDVPEAQQRFVTANSFVSINVPIAPAEVVAAQDPFIPVDAVYQSQDKAYVLVVEKGVAVTKEIQLGNVYGSYVEALRGLSSGDHIILDRTVIAGEKITIQ